VETRKTLVRPINLTTFDVCLRTTRRERDRELEVGQRFPDLAELSQCAATRDQRLDAPAVKGDDLVEVLDRSLVSAFAACQQDSAAEVSKSALGIAPYCVGIGFKSALRLAEAVKRCCSVCKIERIGILRIDNAVVVPKRLRIIGGSEYGIAQCHSGNTSRQPCQCDFPRFEHSRPQRLGTGPVAVLGIVGCGPSRADAGFISCSDDRVGCGNGRRKEPCARCCGSCAEPPSQRLHLRPLPFRCCASTGPPSERPVATDIRVRRRHLDLAQTSARRRFVRPCPGRLVQQTGRRGAVAAAHRPTSPIPDDAVGRGKPVQESAPSFHR
jgi:hypothetical protein